MKNWIKVAFFCIGVVRLRPRRRLLILTGILETTFMDISHDTRNLWIRTLSFEKNDLLTKPPGYSSILLVNILILPSMAQLYILYTEYVILTVVAVGVKFNFKRFNSKHFL